MLEVLALPGPRLTGVEADPVATARQVAAELDVVAGGDPRRALAHSDVSGSYPGLSKMVPSGRIIGASTTASSTGKGHHGSCPTSFTSQSGGMTFVSPFLVARTKLATRARRPFIWLSSIACISGIPYSSSRTLTKRPDRTA